MTRRDDRGAVGVGVLAVAVPLVAVAGVAGFALQRTLADDSPAAVELPDNRYAAPVVACPGGPAVSELHNGDRVFAIGVHDEDGWLLIRNPLDPAEHWYIESRWVTTDGDGDDLPVVGCDDPVPAETDDEGEIAAPAESTTTSVDDSTTTTESTTTTVAEQPSTPTTTPTTPTTRPATPTTKPSTPTTTQPPAPAPTIGGVTRNPAAIIEEWDSVCGSGPYTATVTATGVSNATSVRMSWSGPASGSTAMSGSGSTRTATLGPFDETTVASGSATIHVTVTATGPGGSTSRSTSVTIHDCYFG